MFLFLKRTYYITVEDVGKVTDHEEMPVERKRPFGVMQPEPLEPPLVRESPLEEMPRGVPELNKDDIKHKFDVESLLDNPAWDTPDDDNKSSASDGSTFIELPVDKDDVDDRAYIQKIEGQNLKLAETVEDLMKDLKREREANETRNAHFKNWKNTQQDRITIQVKDWKEKTNFWKNLAAKKIRELNELVFKLQEELASKAEDKRQPDFFESDDKGQKCLEAEAKAMLAEKEAAKAREAFQDVLEEVREDLEDNVNLVKLLSKVKNLMDVYEKNKLVSLGKPKKEKLKKETFCKYMNALFKNHQLELYPGKRH